MKPALKNNFSCLALKYNLHVKEMATLWNLGYRYLLNYLDPLVNRSVLDIGRDNGVFSNILRESGANIMSIDIAANTVSLSGDGMESKNIYYEIKPGSLDFLPVNSFDFVVSRFVFGTIPTREGILKILKSISRSLRKNGSVIIMNENWDKSNGKEFVSFKLDYKKSLNSGNQVTSVIKTNPPVLQKDIYWSKEDYSVLLTLSGFEIYSIEEPVIKEKDPNWISEEFNPPYYMIFAKKKNKTKYS